MTALLTFKDGDPLKAADLNAIVPGVPNAGDDLETAWVTAGFVAASGITLTTVRLRRLGMLVQVTLDPFTVASLAIPVSGDIANMAVCTVPVPFRPVNVQPLTSGSTGRLAAGYINGAGTIALSAVAPTATQTAALTVTNEQFSLGGVYFLG